MTHPVVEFWFDFASTYSYVSAKRIGNAAAQAGASVCWVPFLLGPIFKAQGWDTSPFNIYKARGRYMWRDVERLCALHGLPFKRPDIFPQFALLPARIAVAARDEPWLPDYCCDLFDIEYGQGQDITSPEASCKALEKHCDDPQLWIARAAEPETKAQLRQRSDLAVEKGIFGAPSFVCEDGELFWGDDRLEQALDWATGLRRQAPRES